MNNLLGDTADGRDFKDLELGPSSPSAPGIPVAPGQDRTQFVQEVKEVTIEIQKRLLMLQKSNEDYRAKTRATDLRVIKEEMGEVLDELCVIAGELREKLEALDRSNAANRNITNYQAGSSTDRSRTSITSNLKKSLGELAVHFQGLGLRFQVVQRDIVQKHLLTVTGQKVHESVIEGLIETGGSDPIFRNAILTQGRGVVLDTIAEIQERRDAVKDIEKKLLELHQIFLHTGILVEAQAEPPDNIKAEIFRHTGILVEAQAERPDNIKAEVDPPADPTTIPPADPTTIPPANPTTIPPANPTTIPPPDPPADNHMCLIISIILVILAAIILVVALVIQPWKSDTK